MAMLHRLSRRVLRAASREVSASPSAPALVASPPWLAPWRVASLSTSARAGSREGRASPPPRTRPNVASANAAPRDALTASTSARGRPTTRAGTSPTSARRVAHRPGRVVAGSFTGPTRYPRTLAPTKRSRERPARWDGAARGLVEDRRAGAPRASSTNIATSATRAGDEGQAANPRETVGRSDSIANATAPTRATSHFFARTPGGTRKTAARVEPTRARDGETRRSARRARGGGGCGGGGVLAQIRGTRLPGAPSRRVSRPRSRRLRLQSRGISRVRVLLHPSRPSERGESFDGDAGPGERGVVRALRGVGYRARNEPRRRDTQSFAPRVREALAPGRARLGGR